MRKGYITRQRESGIKAGDIVLITRKPNDYEDGWACAWNEEGRMDKFVGKRVVIKGVEYGHESLGLMIHDPKRLDSNPPYTWWIPYFICQKVVEKPKDKFNKKELEMNGEKLVVSEPIYNLLSKST